MRDDQIIQTINLIRSMRSMADLRAFIKSPLSKEGYCHDFKVAIPNLSAPKGSGEEKENEKSLVYRFRSAVAALANSHGGFLIAGVEDKTHKVHGCNKENDIKKHIDDLVSVISPQPEIVHLPELKLSKQSRWIYILEVLPSPSFRKPHFFNGRVYYRTRDASSCCYVKSAAELSERVQVDVFHFGSIRSFKRFVQTVRREPHNIPFSAVRYFSEIGSYLEERRKDVANERLVLGCIEAFNIVDHSLRKYSLQYSSLGSPESVSKTELNEQLDNFEGQFIKILEVGANG